MKKLNNSPQADDSTSSSSGATEYVRGATPQTAVSKLVDTQTSETETAKALIEDFNSWKKGKEHYNPDLEDEKPCFVNLPHPICDALCERCYMGYRIREVKCEQHLKTCLQWKEFLDEIERQMFAKKIVSGDLRGKKYDLQGAINVYKKAGVL